MGQAVAAPVAADGGAGVGAEKKQPPRRTRRAAARATLVDDCLAEVDRAADRVAEHNVRLISERL